MQQIIQRTYLIFLENFNRIEQLTLNLVKILIAVNIRTIEIFLKITLTIFVKKLIKNGKYDFILECAVFRTG
jgi:hypothetical protein